MRRSLAGYHPFKNRWMNINQKADNISADEQRMKKDGKKMSEPPDHDGRMGNCRRFPSWVFVIGVYCVAVDGLHYHIL